MPPAQAVWQATKTEGGFVAIGRAANAAGTGGLAGHQDRGRFCCNGKSEKCCQHRHFGGPSGPRAVLLQFKTAKPRQRRAARPATMNEGGFVAIPPALNIHFQCGGEITCAADTRSGGAGKARLSPGRRLPARPPKWFAARNR